MSFHRISGVFVYLVVVTLAVSCSSTSNTTEGVSGPTEKSSMNRTPDWYSSARMIQSEDEGFSAYATAIDTDSAASVTKAREQAKSELQSGVSSRLESVRSEAVIELGSDSGLDSPKFLIALRNAESDIASVSEINQTEVMGMESGNYRAFAKAYIERETLISELDKALAANGNAWNNLKNSKAFAKF